LKKDDINHTADHDSNSNLPRNKAEKEEENATDLIPLELMNSGANIADVRQISTISLPKSFPYLPLLLQQTFLLGHLQ